MILICVNGHKTPEKPTPSTKLARLMVWRFVQAVTCAKCGAKVTVTI